MVSSVQGATAYQPGMQLNSADKVSSEQLNNPGLFTNPKENPKYSGDLTSAVMRDAGIPEPKEEHHSSIFGKTVLTALVLTATAVGLRKGVFNNIKGVDAEEGKLTELAKDAKFVDKAKYYYAKSTDWIYSNTVEKVVNMLKSKKNAKEENGTSPASETGGAVDTEA